MVVMSDDYKGLLRTIYGEPTVDGDLWDTVTSVGEGDEVAYADALVAIGRAYGYYCVEPAIEDERTPGAVLDAILGGWPTVQHLWQMVAKHPNVTANVERWCRQKRSVKLNAALAASPGVSDETVKRFLPASSQHTRACAIRASDSHSVFPSDARAVISFRQRPAASMSRLVLAALMGGYRLVAMSGSDRRRILARSARWLACSLGFEKM